MSEITAAKLRVAAACLLGSMFVPYVQVSIGPLMMLPMIGEFGWTRTQFAFATTFLFVSGSVTALALGWAADRFGPRSILLFGALCGGATMLLLSRQGAELWRLYLAYGLLGACGSSGLGYTKVIGSLFARHRGKALAIFGAESTLALAILPLLTNALIVNFGWRATYVVFGVIMLAVAPLLYFAVRGPGLSTPTPPPGASAAGAVVPPAEGLTPSEMRRDSRFWIIVVAGMLGGGLHVGFMAHVIAAITDKGFTPTTAAGVMSIATFVGLAGTLVSGFAMDYFRTARVMAIFACTYALGYALFALSGADVGGLPLLVAGMALTRIAMSALVPATSYSQTRFVGMRSFGEAYALYVLVVGVAMGVAPPLFGALQERFDSYQPMYWTLCVAALVGAALYLALGPYRYGVGSGANVPKRREK